MHDPRRRGRARRSAGRPRSSPGARRPVARGAGRRDRHGAEAIMPPTQVAGTEDVQEAHEGPEVVSHSPDAYRPRAAAMPQIGRGGPRCPRPGGGRPFAREAAAPHAPPTGAPTSAADLRGPLRTTARRRAARREPLGPPPRRAPAAARRVGRGAVVRGRVVARRARRTGRRRRRRRSPTRACDAATPSRSSMADRPRWLP